MTTVTLKVEGMNCEHCQAAVTKALRGVAGVLDADVSLQRNEARVTYDPGRADVASLVAAVDGAGYAVGDVAQ